MDTMASRFNSLTIIYSTVYSGADQRKHQSSASPSFVRVSGRFSSQRVGNAKNVSIWWRHHVCNYSDVQVCVHYEKGQLGVFIMVVRQNQQE